MTSPRFDRFVEDVGTDVRHVFDLGADERGPSRADALGAGGDASELRFPTRWLERRRVREPSRSPAPSLLELEGRLAASRRERLHGTSFSERVRAVLLRRLGRERIDQTSVAAELCLTRRTLR